jgi:hypothetical protein
MTSIIKVDNLQNQCGANIINENAGTITIGASGDTVTLAAGASQSGFGRSGSVNWDTTPKTTSPVTAVSGNGYFIDTTSGAITINLPATPSAGDIVAIADYNGTALTNNITVGRNSSDINGSATDLTINANYSAVTLVYVDATSGWRSVDTSNISDIETPPEFVAATGGTITCDGDYKIHTFTGPGTFTVTNAGNVVGSNSVDYLIVAGGGAGGTGSIGGGGGGGGFREGTSGGYTASPLANPVGVTVTATSYPIVVGGGGTKGTSGPEDNNGTGGTSGIASSGLGLTSAGGGSGASSAAPIPNGPGQSGGSGGGNNSNITAINSGNTPPVAPPQGNPGGNYAASPAVSIGSGGGAATSSIGAFPWVGGTGATTSISASPTVYAGGGGGGKNSCVPVPGGTSPLGGGAGGPGGGGGGSTGPVAGGNGTTNTGGGGGGGGRQSSVISKEGGNGGSGIVVIRYKFQ